MRFWFQLATYFYSVFLSSGQTLDKIEFTLSDAVNVSQSLNLSKSNPVIPPIVSKPLNIDIGFVLHSLASVNTRDQSTNLVGTLIVSWIDPALAWNNMTNPLTVLRVRNWDIWTPHFILFSGTKGNLHLTSDGRFDSVQVFSTGKVVMKIVQGFDAACNDNPYEFPYDVNTCTLTLDSQSPSQLVNFTILPGMSAQTFQYFFSTNNEWDVKLMTQNASIVQVNDELRDYGFQVSRYQFTIIVNRKPLYYVVLVVLPVLMSTVLIPTFPLIPVDSGERLTIIMSFFLAFVLFLLLVDNILPKGNFAALTISMAISVALVLVNLFESILVINYDRKVITIDNAQISPDPNEVQEVGEEIEEVPEEVPASKSRIKRWKKMLNLRNPKIRIRRIDQALFLFDILAVLVANCWILSRLLPKVVVKI